MFTNLPILGAPPGMQHGESVENQHASQSKGILPLRLFGRGDGGRYKQYPHQCVEGLVGDVQCTRNMRNTMV